jgi:glycosyltransferase involved in cell wall biosynthesis
MTSATAGDVSVVVPTFNRAELLRHTLATLEHQTVPPAEIIVVDDGSTDATQEMLAERTVTVITNPDGGWGPARARNVGLERVSTTFVAFVDSDDLLPPRALELLSGALRDAPAAPFAYGCALAVMQVDGEWVHQGVIAPTRSETGDERTSMFVRNNVPASGALARTEAVRAAGGYDVTVEWSEDHHLWIRLAQQGAPIHVPEIVCAYRRHSGNRYVAAIGGADSAAIFELAKQDPALRPYVSDRVGVLVCEALAEAVRERRPAGFARVVGHLLPHSSRPDRVIAGAASHFRKRRASARLGDRVWRERPDIRDWLAGF